MSPNQLSVASITPTSFVTYTMTSYKFDFTLKDPLPQNGYF
jgi:hypothetical protein